MKYIINTYAHNEDDDSVEEQVPTELWKDEDTMYRAMNWGYEIGFKVEVDTQTGESKILEINEGYGWKKLI